MAGVTLTDEQAGALDHSSNVALLAGAGSGKTLVLTRRYLDILDANPSLSVRNILAITFTERAAAEMLERIRAGVRERRRGADTGRWAEVYEELATASISTIHAFCAALLRMYSPEAGVSPDFETLDEPSAGMMLEETIAEATDPLNGELHDELKFLLRRWSAGNVRDVLRGLLSALEVSRKDLVAAAAASPDEMVSEWAEKVSALQECTVRGLSEQTNLLSLLKRIESAAEGGGDGNIAVLVGAVRETRVRLEAGEQVAGAIRDLVPLFVTGAGGARRRFPGSKQRLRAADMETYKSAAMEVGRIIAPHAALLSIRADGETDRAAAEHLAGLARVASWALSRYESRKREEGALDFTDLQWKAFELLEGNGEVLERVRARYRYLMVDEFQDINPLQWNIVRLLASKGDRLARDKLFIVGDPLQSIYGFRHAHVELLSGACEEMAKAAGRAGGRDPKVIRMATNFRSHPNMIRFTDFLFDRLLEEPRVVRERFEPAFQSLGAHREGIEECGSVEVLAALRAPGSPPFAREGECIAARIREMVDVNPVAVWDREVGELRPVAFSDIAILLRGRTHLEQLERALRASGVPYVLTGGIGFFGQPEVTDLVNFLRFVVSPWNDLAVASMLRSPLFSTTDEALLRLALAGRRLPLWGKILELRDLDEFEEGDANALRQMKELGERLLEKAGRASPGQLIQELLDETGACGSYAAGPRGHQAIANIRKLTSLLHRLNTPFRPLPDLVRVLELQMERAAAEAEAPLHLESEDAVRIMTIHAAKGLEFPVVILADLGRQAQRPQRALLIERDLGLGLALPSGGARSAEEKCSLRRAAEERLRRREDAEEKRLLYVAMTRARDHLVLSGEVKPEAKLVASASNWMIKTLAFLGIGELSCGLRGMTVGEEPPAAFRLRVVGLDEQPSESIAPEDAAEVKDEADLYDQSYSFSWLAAPIPVAGRRELSVTALAEYVRCPQAYYLSQQARVGDMGSAGTAAQERGSFIHKVLQLSLGKTEKELQNLCELLVQQVRGLTPGERKTLRAEALDAVRAVNLSRVGELSGNAEQVLPEVPVSFRTGRAILNGTIDRLCVMPGNLYALVDFKTDRIETDEVEKRASEYKLQLDAYCMGVSKAFSVPLANVRAIICFTSPGETAEWVVSVEDGEALGARIERIAETIAKGEFAAAPSEHCAECVHRELGVCEIGTDK